MQAARTTKGNQSEVARIMAAFNGDMSQRTLHIRRHDVNYSLCGFNRSNLPPSCYNHVGSQSVQRSTSASFIQFEFASEQCRVRKMTEHDVRISNRRQQRSAVTRRPRISSGGLGSDTKRTAFIDAGNRSSA